MSPVEPAAKLAHSFTFLPIQHPPLCRFLRNSLSSSGRNLLERCARAKIARKIIQSIKMTLRVLKCILTVNVSSLCFFLNYFELEWRDKFRGRNEREEVKVTIY